MEDLKCILVGSVGRQKNALVIACTTNAFPGEHVHTVFDDYSAIVMPEGLAPVNLHMWNTSNQEDYAKLSRLSYQNTDVFMLCFSLVDPKSLEKIETFWLPEIMIYCSGAPYILVGLESDLRDNFDEIDHEPTPKGYSPISSKQGQLVADKNIRQCIY